MAEAQRLRGKSAIVTGAASGFGAGIARRFVEEGARVAIVDKNIASAEALAAELGDSAMALACDVSSARDVEAVRDATLARFGRIDILVNNAAVPQSPTPLEEVEEDVFDRLLAVNVKALYVASRAIVPVMRAGGGGAIVNIGSTGGVRPRPNLTWYNATKGFVLTATKAMAVELAPARIRVNAINPVAGDTPMLAAFMGDGAKINLDSFIASIPLGRLCQPSDIGAAAAFLCSDDGAFITGVALEVDGGRCV